MPGQRVTRTSEPGFWATIALIALVALATTAAGVMLRAWTLHLGLTWGLG